MDPCRLGDARCIEGNIRAQVEAYSRVPKASELSSAGVARLAQLQANGRTPEDFELLELHLKGQVGGPSDAVFDGFLRRSDVTALMKAANVNSDRYIRDFIAGMFMETLDKSPTDGKISADEWRAAEQGRPTGAPAPPAPVRSGVSLIKEQRAVANPPQPLPDRNFTVALRSPTFRNGGSEAMTVESTIPFPRYNEPAWRTDGNLYHLKQYPPINGTYGRVYRNGNSAVFEIDLKFDVEYFHQIIYYPDLTHPVPHKYAKFGVGAHFKEFAVEPTYKPEDLFLGFQP